MGSKVGVGGGRMRWLLAFTVVLLISSAVPVLAEEPAEAPSEPTGFTPPTSQEEEIAAAQIPDADEVNKALAELESKEREQEEWLASPEAIQQREDSLLAYVDLSPGESEQLLSSVFQPQLEALNGDPSRFLSDAQLVQPVGDSGAIVKDGGDGSLMDSSVPVRTEDEDGDLSKVDLTLEATPQGFETDNAIADLTLPVFADEAIQVGEEGFAITQAGAAGSPARRFGDKNLFYPSVLPDTDLLVAANSFGAELFDLLRSEDSPEELRFASDVPPGAELRSDGRGGAEVVREGETLTHIPPPSALDAQQTAVPVELQVEGSSIALQISHRGGDFAYPILLDPIVEDWANTGSNWYEGKNLAALSNGAWKWTSNNGNIAHDICCWGGNHPGLLTNVQDAFYGPEQFGQWSYSTANGHVLIVHAWATPFWRADNGCGSKQPHDYAGLWNPGDQWYPIVSDEAKNKGFVSMDGWGQAFVLGEGSGPPGVWLACDRLLYAGGVALWLDDTWGPWLSANGVPTEWFSDSNKVTIKVNSGDEGLGVHRVTITPEGKPVIQDNVGYCTGLYGSPCPNEHTSTFEVTGDSFGEGIRKTGAVAEDPTGKTGGTQFTTKVDRTPPELTLSGQLALATNEDKGDSQDPKKWEDLNLPVYNLKMEATDGALTSDLTKRAGVKNIELFLDEKAITDEFWLPLASCPATSCKMTQTYSLKLAGLASGKHTLEVKAVDFVNKLRERKIEFEYFPATGMKDEYVMHRFPLPDGQGNEAEEEHPARPELAVNVMNGNLVYRERDIDIEGPAVNLEVERFYNSMLPDSQNSEWGDGWTLAQTPDLKPIKSEGSPVPDLAELRSTSGSLENGVALPTTAGAETFNSELQATLTKKPAGGYELTDETGESATAVSFNEDGRTEARLTDGFAKVDYSYESGVLSEIEVEDPATFSADPEELEEFGTTLIDKPTYASSFSVLGTGDGQLKSPGDVAVDAQGNLWVVDKSNNRIEKFDPTGKYLAKFGTNGTGNGQFNRPTSIAIASNGDLLITDAGNGRVQRFSSSGTYISKFGATGTGNGQFTAPGPESIAIDASGYIWVSDSYAHRLQKFTAGGSFVKAIGSKGTGGGQFSYPGGIDVDAGGNVWVADWQNNRIEVFNSNGEFLSQFGSTGTGDGQLNHPDEIEIDKHGNVWVGDQGNNRIQRFDVAGQFLGKFGMGGSGSGQFNLGNPMGIAADSKGHLWVADVNNNRIQDWLVPIPKPTYGSSFGSNGSGDGQFKYPSDIAVDLQGNLWVADKSNNRIEKFTRQGQFLAKYGSLGSGNGQFNRPSSIAVDRDGNILVADSNNHRIQKFNMAGEFISKFGSLGSGNGQFKKPEEVVADPKGNIWVADTENARVQQFDEEGQFLKAFGAGTLGVPTGVDVDSSGNVWVADWSKNRITVFDSNGAFKSHVGTTGQFNHPDGIEIDNKGNVWVGDQSNNRIQQLNLAGQKVGEFGSVGSGEGQFNLDFPMGIASDAEGRLWITDVINHRVQRWLIANYAATAGTLDLKDGDPSVEVDSEAGLVSAVAGGQAGEHDYSHVANRLTSHDGPDGETKYTYDSTGRMTSVTLPNGTAGTIVYNTISGRVKSVTVDPAGAAPAKKTEFEYTDEPRRTTVVPPDAPHVTYDIGADGSVLKWWNAQQPPVFDDIAGTLYDNREKSTAIWVGDHNLSIQAHSEEGIASIQVLINGSVLVDEKTCAQDPEKSGIECKTEINEWVTSTELHPPGRLNVEVIITDRLGQTASERFWINIPPPPPPPAPGTPIPPKFRDIAKFREDYGLEVVDPVANEIELNERIFNLIKAWYEANTPEGQVARATMNRWGVPLRPRDVAELEYRTAYWSQAGKAVPAWAATNASNSFAGMYIDHPAGGVIRTGFTGDQSGQLNALKQGAGLMAPDRFAPFSFSPQRSLVSLQGVEDQVWAAEKSYPAGLINRVVLDVKANVVSVGATDVNQATSRLHSDLGSQAPIQVYYSPSGLQPQNDFERITGPILGGDEIILSWAGPCSAGFGAFQQWTKPNGQPGYKMFVLTAGHCVLLYEEHVSRRSNPNPTPAQKQEIGVTKRTGYDENPNTMDTDAAAILLKSNYLLPRQINASPAPPIDVKGMELPGQGTRVCHIGRTSKEVLCGEVISGQPEFVQYADEEGNLEEQEFLQICFEARSEGGDSGGMTWIEGTNTAVGILVSATEPPAVPVSCFTPLMPYPGRADIPGALADPGMAPLQLGTQP